MSKKRDCCLNKSMFWLFLLPLLWFAISMWHYKCNINNACSISTINKTVKNETIKKTVVSTTDLDSKLTKNLKTIEKIVPTEKTVLIGIGTEKEEKKENTKTTIINTTKKCTGVLSNFIAYGVVNNSSEVKILEKFLNDYEGENLIIDGKYGKEDFEAVKRFQLKYNKDILANDTIWKDINQKPTGYVYKTTRKKINEIYCSKQKK